MAGHHLRLALLNSALCWPDIENHSRRFWSMHSGRTQQSSTPVRNSTLTLRRLPLSQPMGTSLADAPDQLVLDATCLSAGGQADWFEAIIGKKPLSHVHSSMGGNLRQALTLNCSQPMAITLAGFHPIRCSLFPFSDSHTRRGVTFSQQQSLRGQSLQSNQNHPLFSQIQILRPPIRIILSLQSTNQNHPLSLSSYWPLMWGVWVVKMKGGLSIAVIGPSGALVIAPLLPIPATLPVPSLPVTSTGSTLTVTAGVSVAPRPRRLISWPRIRLLWAVIAGLVRGGIAGWWESIAQAGSRGGIRRLVKGWWVIAKALGLGLRRAEVEPCGKRTKQSVTVGSMAHNKNKKRTQRTNKNRTLLP